MAQYPVRVSKDVLRERKPWRVRLSVVNNDGDICHTHVEKPTASHSAEPKNSAIRGNLLRNRTEYRLTNPNGCPVGGRGHFSDSQFEYRRSTTLLDGKYAGSF
jgi:hypothetical protein